MVFIMDPQAPQPQKSVARTNLSDAGDLGDQGLEQQRSLTSLQAAVDRKQWCLDKETNKSIEECMANAINSWNVM